MITPIGHIPAPGLSLLSNGKDRDGLERAVWCTLRTCQNRKNRAVFWAVGHEAGSVNSVVRVTW